jgi:hypothetical protein
VSWPELADTLRTRKLLATLGPRILEVAHGHATGEFASAVEQSLAAGRRHSVLLALVSEQAIGVLADANIPCAPLKGPPLAEAIYGDAGRRLSNDIDLLVGAEQLAAAAQAMRGMGYHPVPHQHADRSGLPLLHVLLLHERGELPPLELHWRIHWYERRFAHERLLPPAASAGECWRPAPVDELAALLLFYARDGFAGLRQASDLAAWWDVHHGELAPTALGELRRAYPALSRVLVVAAVAAERVVGLPAPEILSESAKPGLRGRVAARLANPNPDTSQSQLYAEMGLIDGLLAPHGGLIAFARRQLFPPREVREQHARDGRRRRRRSRLARGVGMLLRYGLAMRSVARPAWTGGEARRRQPRMTIGTGVPERQR